MSWKSAPSSTSSSVSGPVAELPRDVERERDDLLRVVVRVRVLLLERVRERGQRLAVEALHRLRVLELEEERAGLADEELAELDVVRGEAPVALVVDLDEHRRVARRLHRRA